MRAAARRPQLTVPALPALRGAAIALAAALLFGASTPLVQRLGHGLGPFTTAALLYAGAAAFGLLTRRRVEREAALRSGDAPRVLTVAFFGAALGPAAFAWGLQRTGAAGASLLLALEVVFTAAFAGLLLRESIGARVAVAMALLAAGGTVLALGGSGSSGGSDPLLGAAAIVLATAAWGLDNTLSRPLAERDPGQVVMWKAVFGAGLTGALAAALAEPRPGLQAALGLLAVGATGYGLSLRCYLLAQRAFGAARTSSVFAFAPFVGALLALALGDHGSSAYLLGGGALMAAGLVLHLAESHRHAHSHETLAHEHAHRHDDDHHHDHAHDPVPAGMHSHAHVHLPQRHSHAHVPDAHHAHEH